MLESTSFTVTVSIDDQSGKMGVELVPSDPKLFMVDDLANFKYTPVAKKAEIAMIVAKWAEKVANRKIKALQDELAGRADRLRQAKETLGGLL